MLREEGYDCWTAGEAGLATEGQDDNLSVYADSKQAVLVTHDREFSQRRMKYPIGKHIWLHCSELVAAEVLRSHLDEVVALLQRDHVTIEITESNVKSQSRAE
jgi:predicted nuclease of predicted toxin-antitoxin system